jgi:Phage portal protein, SPP1 Gp6-like
MQMYDPMQPRTLTVGSLEWWLDRLGRRLDGRRDQMQMYENYYAGRQPLAFVSDTFRAAFGDRFRVFSANFMSLVVNTHRQRLKVQGIRIGDHDIGSPDAWDWWQRNRLDSESLTAFTEMLVKGIVYVLVWPDADTGEPEATIESPLQVVVETVPGKSWKRRAALKRWLADDGKYRAELYMPDGIYKFTSSQSAGDFSVANWSQVAQWTRDEGPEAWPVVNKLGVIPIVPLVNRPRLTGVVLDAYGRTMPGVGPDEGQSELAPVMSNQDVINKLRADMVNASDLAAFRQRWLKNWQVEIDEKTGQPIEPFKSAVDRLWILPPPDTDDPTGDQHQAEFGEFQATDLSSMIADVNLEMRQLGAISQTPFHMLLEQSGQPPSGDSIKSSESGLTGKVADTKVYTGEPLEEVFRLNFAWIGDKRSKDMGAEIIWAPSESQSEAVHTDAVGKWGAMGVPDEARWEALGFTPRQIVRFKEMRDAAIAASPPAPPDVAPTVDTTMPMVHSALAQGGN